MVLFHNVYPHPACGSALRDDLGTHCANIQAVSQQQKIFRADDRYASDHMTVESINATKQHWKDLMPRMSIMPWTHLPSFLTTDMRRRRRLPRCT